MDLESALALLNSDSVTAQDLADIAYEHPRLRPLVASHPLTYPDLLTWLAMLREPAVDAALTARANDGRGSESQQPPTGPPRRRRTRRSIIIGLAIVVVLGIAAAGVSLVTQMLHRGDDTSQTATDDQEDQADAPANTVPRLLDIPAPAGRTWTYDPTVDRSDDPDTMGDEGYTSSSAVSDSTALITAYATEASFTPDYWSWQLSLLDLTDGQTSWTRSLVGDLISEDFFASVATDNSMEIDLHTEYDNRVAVLTVAPGDESSSPDVSSQVVVIDLETGQTLGATILEGLVGDTYRSTLIGDQFLATLRAGESLDEPQNFAPSAMALPVSDIAGPPAWKATLDSTTVDMAWTRLSPTRAALQQASQDGESTTSVHDVSSGAVLPFFSAAQYGAMGSWYFASDTADLGSLEYGFDGAGDISRLDNNGQFLWSKSSTALRSMDDMLIAAPECRQETADISCAGWRRIDPTTGEDLWSTPLEVGLRPIGAEQGRILVGRAHWSGTPHNTWSYTEFLWVDPETGAVLTELGSVPAASYYYFVGIADTMVYVLHEGHLDAYEAGESTPLWTVPIDAGEDGSEYAWRLGAHVVVHADSGILTGIGTTP